MSAARESNEYVLGTQDAELRRLGFQHRLWSRQAAQAWEAAQFRPGQRLLDIGCGPGFATTELAQLVGPGGAVVGVDASERFINYLRARAAAISLPQVDARVGDVLNLDLPPAAFDGAYARWVLCFVSDPARVVRGVAAALKPGGVFVIQDYYDYRGAAICPTRPVVRKVFEAVDQSWRRRGGDPDVGQRLPTLLAEAAFDVQRIDPLVRVARPDTALWNWPATFFANYLPVLIEMNLITSADAEEWNDHWQQRTADPASAFITPPMLSILAVRRGE
ncbi:MAG: methyltransferase domain-containing protein [Phycisphaerales bacterium]|nr:methyltransferase domain-containing protein [Phycisphaerales bacterium]